MGTYIYNPPTKESNNITHVNTTKQTQSNTKVHNVKSEVEKIVKQISNNNILYSLGIPIIGIPIPVLVDMTLVGACCLGVCCCTYVGFKTYNEKKYKEKTAKEEAEMEYLKLLTEFNKVRAENNKISLSDINSNDKQYKTNNNIVGHETFKELF